MSSKKKVLIIIFVFLILLVAAAFGYYYYKTHNKEEQIPENKPATVEAIEAYKYQLEDRDTKLFKDTFEELKTVLSEEKVDYTKYAELLSKLYIIDLYTINNKISKYDVGGGDYVYPENRDNYELKVRDTLYKYMEDNSYNTRKQDLPEVASIEVTSSSENEYTLGEKKYPGYKVELKWDYTKEEDYDGEAVLYLIKDDIYLYIVEQTIGKKN